MTSRPDPRSEVIKTRVQAGTSTNTTRLASRLRRHRCACAACRKQCMSVRTTKSTEVMACTSDASRDQIPKEASVTLNTGPDVQPHGRGLLHTDDYDELMAELAQVDPDLAFHVESFGFDQLLARPLLSRRDRTLGLAAALAGDGQAPTLLGRHLRS